MVINKELLFDLSGKTAMYGSIINMSSMASINKSPAISAYASSKASINHMTRNLAFDFGPDNIRINAVVLEPPEPML